MGVAGRSGVWTEVNTAKLRSLWSDGHSATTVAVQIGDGFTRSAILGKVKRLGLPARETQKTIRPRPSRQQSRKPVLVPSSECRVNFFGLDNHHCRYPLWEDGTPFAEQFYCGSPQASMIEGRSFCAFHQRIVWSKEAA